MGLAEGCAGSRRPAASYGLGFALIVAAALAFAAPALADAVALSRQIAELYETASILPPTESSMTVCYGFDCRRREMLDFTREDLKALTQIMASGAASAAAERAAVQKAVIWLDRRMGPVIGTDKRVARADFHFFDAAHNYDCWDITRNTTSLVLVLQQWGLLKYHAVGDPRYRGNTLQLQRPHNTAVLIDHATMMAWAVDLWPHAYLEPPDVMPIEKWVKEN
jgi:hypothetical protein